jgi:hypothetical protein
LRELSAAVFEELRKAHQKMHLDKELEQSSWMREDLLNEAHRYNSFQNQGIEAGQLGCTRGSFNAASVGK